MSLEVNMVVRREKKYYKISGIGKKDIEIVIVEAAI